MYPAVFVVNLSHRWRYGAMHVLPTPMFFYGIRPEQEIAIDLEPGKTLVIQCLAIGESDAEDNVKVFFELNGQPRTVKTPNCKFADLVEQ